MATANFNKEDLAKKIKALQSKTVENGCTEAEAISAAELIGKLMAQYNISLTEVELAQEEYSETEITPKEKKRTAIYFVLEAIATFTDTVKYDQTYIEDGEVVKKTIKFWGTKKDVEIAEYLFGLIKEAIRAGYRSYMNERTAQGLENGALIKKAFTVAMAGRIAQRLRQMKQLRNAQASTEYGIVAIDKSKIVRSKFDELMEYEVVQSRKFNASNLDEDALMAGDNAGSNVAIVPGVGNSNPKNTLLLS